MGTMNFLYFLKKIKNKNREILGALQCLLNFPQVHKAPKRSHKRRGVQSRIHKT